MTLDVLLDSLTRNVSRSYCVVAACPLDFLAVVVSVSVVVFPRADAFEPVGEKRRGVFRRATDEQVDVVGLDGEVDNLQPFLVGYFVEDVSYTGCNVTYEYRVSVLRYPHYVVVEVVRCVPCGLHPYYTLCFCDVLELS